MIGEIRRSRQKLRKRTEPSQPALVFSSAQLDCCEAHAKAGEPESHIR
jgi:cytochrome c